jgi:hypothetical protein
VEAAVSRRYGDVIEVVRQDSTPAQFLWQGRLYVVTSVLAHWVEAGAWWRGEARSEHVDDGERELWRVEAGRGRMFGIGVYDLCFDWSLAQWQVVRTID